MTQDAIDKKVEFIFRVLSEVELHVVDLSALTRVSRPALHRWKNKKPITDMLRLDMVYTCCQRLKTAKDNGVLPLKEKYKRVERLKVLRSIVANTRLS